MYDDKFSVFLYLVCCEIKKNFLSVMRDVDILLETGWTEKLA